MHQDFWPTCHGNSGKKEKFYTLQTQIFKKVFSEVDFLRGNLQTDQRGDRSETTGYSLKVLHFFAQQW